MSRRSRRKLLVAAETVHKSGCPRPRFEVPQGEWVADDRSYVVDKTVKKA